MDSIGLTVNIGGRDRCMMNTIRLLQGWSNVVKKGKPLIPKRGFFEMQREDMDKLLVGHILNQH
jgi:hypothetical protein